MISDSENKEDESGKESPEKDEAKKKQEEANLEAQKSQDDKELETIAHLRKNIPLKVEVQKFDDYILINVVNSLNYDTVKLFQLVVKHEVIKPYIDLIENYIINCKQVGVLDTNGMREFVQLQVQLKRRNKKMFIAELSKELQKNMALQGLDKTFTIKDTVKSILVDLGVVKKKAFDVNFLNPFIDAMMKVMQVQCFTEAKAGAIIVLKPSEFPPADISGIIGVVSDTFTGTIVIHFKKDVYLKIGAKMLGEGFNDKSTEFLDAVGEMANMVLGQAKAQLNQMGYNISQALPSVSYGKDQIIKTISPSPSILVPFTTEHGMFHIQITTKLN